MSLAVARTTSSPGDNRVLARLSPDDRRRLTPHLERVHLVPGANIGQLGTVAADVHFPVTATISLRSLTQDGSSVEIALVGDEGIVGLPHVLDGLVSQHDAIVQTRGSACRMRADVFLAEFARANAFQVSVGVGLRSLLAQTSQAALCHRFHRVPQRLARSLLVRRDRAATDTFRLTQETLALQLGTSRSSVSTAATVLQDQGIIKLRHGLITVINRAALEKLTCECYSAVKVAIGESSTSGAR